MAKKEKVVKNKKVKSAAAKPNAAKSATKTKVKKSKAGSSGPAKKSKVPATQNFTQTALIAHLADKSETDPKTVKKVYTAMQETLLAQVAGARKGIVGFKMLGLNFKFRFKEATKARKGISPFTKEPMVFKAKPASVVLKVLPLTAVKQALPAVK